MKLRAYSTESLSSQYGEDWRDVTGYVGILQASNYGRLRTVRRSVKTCYGSTRVVNPRLIAERPGKSGYLRVHRNYGGTQFAHRLVALAWVANPHELPCINHIDGNKSNNHPDNLEWCTQSENASHAHRIGLSSGMDLQKGDLSIASKLREAQVVEIKQRLAVGDRSIDLAREFGVCKGAIAEIKAGRSWGHVNVDVRQ